MPSPSTHISLDSPKTDIVECRAPKRGLEPVIISDTYQPAVCDSPAALI